MNLLFALGLLMSSAVIPGAPPTPEEERLFAEGLRAFDAGDALTAETTWKQGYAVGHDPAFLVHIGEGQEKNGATRDAAESYRRYLREAPDAADRPEIEARLARLALRLGPSPNEPTTGSTPPATPPPPPTAAPRTPAAVVPPSPRAVPAVDAEDRRPPARRQDQEPSGWNPYNTTAWIGVAATTLLLGTAAFYGAAAASKKDDVNRLVTYRDQYSGAPLEYQSVAAQYQQAIDDGRHDDHVAKLALLAAAGTAAVAATFFIINEWRDSPAELALAPDSRGGGISVAGSWRWRF